MKRKRKHADREEAIKVKRVAAKTGPRSAARPKPGLLSSLGNAQVQRLLRSASPGSRGGPVDDAIARSILARRGGGAELDEPVRRELERTLGHDFSGVRVHTNSEADALSRAVRAEAFTTGRDIFFHSGSYDPGSVEGKKLLTHELTHVAQQSNAPSSDDLTVSSPTDESELQAKDVADGLSMADSTPATATVQRHEPEPEAGAEAGKSSAARALWEATVVNYLGGAEEKLKKRRPKKVDLRAAAEMLRLAQGGIDAVRDAPEIEANQLFNTQLMAIEIQVQERRLQIEGLLGITEPPVEIGKYVGEIKGYAEAAKKYLP